MNLRKKKAKRPANERRSGRGATPPPRVITISASAPPSNPNDLLFLTEGQAALLTGLSASYFAKARMRGDGPPYFKIGRRVLYTRDGIEKWALSKLRQSTSQAANDNAAQHGKEES